MTSSSAIIWQCRRGMRELDGVLTAYARECYATAPVAERAAFMHLLAMDNAALWQCLFQAPVDADETMRRLIGRLHELCTVSQA